MKYEVILTPEAQADVLAAFEYIQERAPLNAARWIQVLYAKMEALEKFPNAAQEHGSARTWTRISDNLFSGLTASCSRCMSRRSASTFFTFAMQNAER